MPECPRIFAYPAAFGDLLAAVLALAAIPAVAMNARAFPSRSYGCSTSKEPWTWIDAIALATIHNAAPVHGRGLLDPGVLVSAASLVTHYITFRVLLAPWPEATKAR